MICYIHLFLSNCFKTSQNVIKIDFEWVLFVFVRNEKSMNFFLSEENWLKVMSWCLNSVVWIQNFYTIHICNLNFAHLCTLFYPNNIKSDKRENPKAIFSMHDYFGILGYFMICLKWELRALQLSKVISFLFQNIKIVKVAYCRMNSQCPGLRTRPFCLQLLLL